MIAWTLLLIKPAKSIRTWLLITALHTIYDHNGSLDAMHDHIAGEEDDLIFIINGGEWYMIYALYMIYTIIYKFLKVLVFNPIILVVLKNTGAL